MRRVTENFHGFPVQGWKCSRCSEVVFDEKQIQPILQYHKLQAYGKPLAVKVGSLGNSKIIRVPKIAEHIYRISKGETVSISLEPKRIIINFA